MEQIYQYVYLGLNLYITTGSLQHLFYYRLFVSYFLQYIYSALKAFLGNRF